MTPEALAALQAEALAGDRSWSAGEFADLLAARGAVLAFLPDGFALGRGVADEAELLMIAVRPSARRKGLGRTLLATFEARAAAGGARRAFLEVAADNLPAQALYSSAGWTETGRRRGYYGGSTDAIVMCKALP